MKKGRNVSEKKYKRNVFFLSVTTIILIVLCMSTFSYWLEGIKYKQETIELKEKLNESLEEEEELKSQISKLHDPEYIAKYAREKYLYSKNGEIIIRIED